MPGTHPTAGDITVKGDGNDFYNGGMMSYGSKESFPTEHTLGIYVPIKCSSTANLISYFYDRFKNGGADELLKDLDEFITPPTAPLHQA